MPERNATADATPILWASNSAASGLLEFRASGMGTSCSTTEPVIKLNTAKVPAKAKLLKLYFISWLNMTDTG